MFSVLLKSHRDASVKMNLRVKGKQYSSGEDMCKNDSCEMQTNFIYTR